MADAHRPARRAPLRWLTGWENRNISGTNQLSGVRMARDVANFVCQSCGSVHTKWSGQCAGCQAWNTLVQETFSAPPGAMKPDTKVSRTSRLQFETLDAEDEAPARMITGIDEFDRVC